MKEFQAGQNLPENGLIRSWLSLCGLVSGMRHDYEIVSVGTRPTLL
jgi:hypothetical protein